DAVRVEAQESSIAEVLAALDKSFNLQYRKSHELNRPVSGTFQGPLSQVISRLLKDCDYILKNSDTDRIEIIFVGLSAQSTDKPSVTTRAPNVQSPPPAMAHTITPPSGPPFRPASYARTIERIPPSGRSAATSSR